MKLLAVTLLTTVVLASGALKVQAEDAHPKTTWDFAQDCVPAANPNFCWIYIQALVDAQLVLHAQGRLEAPLLCGYSDAGVSRKEITKELIQRGVDPSRSNHDPAFSSSPAPAFLYEYLAKKFPCPSS